MQPELLRSMKDSFKGMQGPIPELMKLNMQMFKDFSFIQPEEWSRLKNFQDIFDKSMKVSIHNGHKMLEYFQQATEILEKSWLSTSEQAMKNLKKGMDQTEEVTNKTIRTAKQAASNLKGKQNELWKRSH